MALLIPTVAIGTPICGLISTRITKHAAKMALKKPVPVNLIDLSLWKLSVNITIIVHNGQFVLYVDKHSATNECTNKIIAKICIALVQSFLLFEHQDEPSREIEPKRSWTIIMRVPGVTAAPSRQSIVQVHGPTRARNKKLHGAKMLPNLRLGEDRHKMLG